MLACTLAAISSAQRRHRDPDRPVGDSVIRYQQRSSVGEGAGKFQHNVYRMPELVAMRVFLSYAREDAEVARRLRDDLETAGIKVWFDQDALMPGQRWRREITLAIRSADYFLILLSRHSVNKRGVVQSEVREALDVMRELPDGAVFVLPARIDNVVPSHDLLRDLHWVDLFSNWEEGVRRLRLALFSASEPLDVAEAWGVLELVIVLVEAVKPFGEAVDLELAAVVQPFAFYADLVAITSVLGELIGNAVQHGVVSKTGRHVISVSLTTGDDAVVIHITNVMRRWSDTIVDPRDGRDRPRAASGLRLVEGILQRVGGSLVVASDRTAGSFTVTVSLPRHRDLKLSLRSDPV